MMPKTEDQYPIAPEMWIRTKETGKPFFRGYSPTSHRGLFPDSIHHAAAEYKLPLIALTPWGER